MKIHKKCIKVYENVQEVTKWSSIITLFFIIFHIIVNVKLLLYSSLFNRTQPFIM